MKSRLALSLAVICVAWLAATGWNLSAQQASPRVEHCKQTSAPQQESPKLTFDDIRLDPSSDVPSDVWQSIAASIRNTDLQAHPGWVDELQQAGVVFTLLDQGYARATATVQASNIRLDPVYQHVDLTVHIETGPQYNISGVTFRSTDPQVALLLSEAELRSLVPLQDGAPFRASKLRLAFDQLRKAYGAQGYVDFVPSPEMRFDDTSRQILLVLDLDQGKQYRIGTIAVLGLSSPLENDLRSMLRPGDVFDDQLLNDFYDSHPSELAADATPADAEVLKDVRAGTVDLVFDFRGCAQIPPDALPPPNSTAPQLLKQLPKRTLAPS